MARQRASLPLVWALLLVSLGLCIVSSASALAGTKSSYSYCSLDSSAPWKKTVLGLDDQSLNIVAPMLAYEFRTSERQVRQSLSYYGSSTRFRKFVADLQAGTRPLKVALIGGSHSWGASALTPGVDDWFTLFKEWLASVTKATLSTRNSCVPGTTPGYLSMCLSAAVDDDADLVLVEYTPNVDIDNRVLYNSFIQDLEKLLQRLLNMPNKPAVVLVNSPHMAGLHDRFSHTMEDLEGALTTYYGVPAVSARPVQHCLVTAVRDSVQNPAEAGANIPGGTAITAEAAHRFAELMKAVHGGSASHSVQRALVDTVVHLFQTAALDMIHNPVTPEEVEFRLKPVPVPMYVDSVPPTSAVCLTSNDFKSAVTAANGWNWVNEGLEIMPRWSYVSSEPLSALIVQLGPYMYGSSGADVGTTLHVAVHFLKSHADMGQASIVCEGGCRCGGVTADARLRVPLTETSVSWLNAAPAPGASKDCRVLVTVINATSTGGHKFAVTGVGIGVMGKKARAMRSLVAQKSSSLSSAAAMSGFRRYW